jgi:hypothetical protein
MAALDSPVCGRRLCSVARAAVRKHFGKQLNRCSHKYSTSVEFVYTKTTEAAGPTQTESPAHTTTRGTEDEEAHDA